MMMIMMIIMTTNQKWSRIKIQDENEWRTKKNLHSSFIHSNDDEFNLYKQQKRMERIK